ncbi:MAG: GLUG motif-containing protein, partial [Eubacteriales bacterium]
MTKKIICLFICAAMMFTMSLSVFAASEPVVSEDETTAAQTAIAANGAEQNGVSSDAANAAKLLGSLGLFRGIGDDEYGNLDFALDRITTRYEAIVMLIRLIGKEAEALREEWDLPFEDVDEWAKPYVGYAYAHGLTSGTAPTAFSGSDEVTAAQFTTFLLRALGYSSGDDFRWDAPWDFAESIGLSADEYADAVTSFFRSDAALLTEKALSAYIKDSGLQLSDKLIFDGIFSRKDYFDILFGKTTDDQNTVWNGAVRPFTGYGFEWSPYLIESAENLAYLAEQVNKGNTYAGKYFRMTADLDLGMHEWVPIGGYDNPFCGIFDGNGYTVHNLYISGFESSDVSDWNQWHNGLAFVGLFGYTSGSTASEWSGTIANLTVDGVIEIKVDAESDKNSIAVGGIVGYAQGDIINCRSNCDISVDSISKDGYVTVGGIAGYHNDTTIDRCTNTGIISGSGIHCVRVGGIVGD